MHQGSSRLRVAYFSPLSPIPSGIADYSEELLPWLEKYFDLDLYVDATDIANREIRSRFHWFHYQHFEHQARKRPYDLALYHMGNSPFHRFIYETLYAHPGVVVLHDFVLHHFIASQTWERGDLEAYRKELQYCGVDAAAALALQVPADQLSSAQRYLRYFHYPLNKRIVESSLGVIVHSQWAASRLREQSPHIPVAQISLHFYAPAGAPPQTEAEREQLRQRLGLAGRLVIGSFGFVTRHKRIPVVLAAIRKILAEFPSVLYLLAGRPEPDLHLDQLIQEYGLADHVRITGHLQERQFFDFIYATDVCVALRYPSAGETSASLIRLLGSGKCVIVSDYNQFSEFPSECVVKIPLDAYEVGMLAEWLTVLLRKPMLRTRIGENAREYIRQNNSLESSARKYAQFLQETHQRLAPWSSGLARAQELGLQLRAQSRIASLSGTIYGPT